MFHTAEEREEIEQMCAIAGCHAKAAGFIAEGKAAAEVLLELRGRAQINGVAKPWRAILAELGILKGGQVK
jgi:hypothetical protein